VADKPANGVGLIKIDQESFEVMKKSWFSFELEELKALRIKLVKKISILEELGIKRSMTIESMKGKGKGMMKNGLID